MFVEKFLLPRFLVLELVLASHFFHISRACSKKLRFMRDADGDSGEIGASASGSSSATVRCLANMGDDTWKYSPLVLSTGSRDWVLPDSNRVISVGDGDTILVSCPGTSFRNASNSLATWKCSGGELVSLGPDTPPTTTSPTADSAGVVTGNQLEGHSCSKSPKHVERATRRPCPAHGTDNRPQGEVVDVGFEVGEEFHPVYSICHDPSTEQTLYTRHRIFGGNLLDRDKDPGRPSFKEGDIFFKSIRASKLYRVRSQRALFSQLFGSRSDSFFEKNNYLAKGHLAPDADFILQDWQESTYYFANAAPQWQSINNGHWKAVEAAVRKFGKKSGKQLDIFTGTLGVLGLQQENNTVTPVHLYNNNGESFLPVPEFFWKLVLDSDARAGIALVTSNNPFLTRVLRSYKFCTDICTEAGWTMNIDNRDEVFSGIVFCCSPSDFASQISWAGPENLDSYSLLTF